MGKASWDREGGMIVSVLLERCGEQRQIEMVTKRKGAAEVGRTDKYQNNKKKKGRRSGVWRRSIGIIRKRKGAVEVGRTEKYRNGKKNGAGKLGRTEKYLNDKKKKGSRKVGENGEVYEW